MVGLTSIMNTKPPLFSICSLTSIRRSVLVAASAAMLLCQQASDAALILHLKLDEGTGTTAANSPTGAPAGTLTGTGSTWTTNVPSQFVPTSAYNNDGTNGASVTYPADYAALGDLGDFTISGWINARSVDGTVGGNDRILSKRGSTAGAAFFDFGFYNAVGGGIGIGLDVQVAGGTVINASRSSAIDFSQGWLFVAATRDATTGVITFYIGDTKGNSIVSDIGSGTDSAGVIAANAAKLMLGNVFSNTARNGDVSYSDFRIYDTILTPTQLNGVRLENLKAIPEPASGALLIMVSPLAMLMIQRRRKKGA